MWGCQGWEEAMCRPGVSSSSEGSPQGLHQQPTVSPVFLILAGAGAGVVSGRARPCSPDKSELFQLKPGMVLALQQP